jgi:hypothetical protein
MKNATVLFLLLMLPGLGAAQKIGVLPFEDASGVGKGFGENVAKFIRSEFLKDKRFLPKFIQYNPAEGEASTIDVDKAVELGRKNKLDYVVIGTILEAEASSSSSGLGGIHVLGQSIGSSVKTVTATITLQGDLISVGDGKLVDSFRTSGSKTDASAGADVATKWGRLDSDSMSGNTSPNAKALREAVEELVNQMIDKLQ